MGGRQEAGAKMDSRPTASRSPPLANMNDLDELSSTAALCDTDAILSRALEELSQETMRLLDELRRSPCASTRHEILLHLETQGRQMAHLAHLGVLIHALPLRTPEWDECRQGPLGKAAQAVAQLERELDH